MARFAAARLSFLLSAVLGLIAAPAPARPGAPTIVAGTGQDWPGHGGSPDESGFSTLSQINRGTIGKLGLAWSLDLDGERAQLQATPLAVGGVLYFTGNMSVVYAVDAKTGRLLWSHNPQIWNHPERTRLFFPVNRGPAYDGGRIFSATLDGRLLALDAKTGRLLWSVETLKPGTLQMVTGAPRTFRGKVIIGNGGGDYGSRGYVTAYDQRTGRQVWRFYTVPGSPEENAGDPVMEAAAKTWSGEYWKTGTGGTAWNGITFDAELGRIYVGTGNSGPYNPAIRSPGDGDNLYLASIVALDADTGKYIWHYQVNPREAWDYKATMNMIAATLMIAGRPRKVLMQAPTNGFFYVIDRETGRLISAEKIGKVSWADRIDLATGRPVERPNIRYETGETIIWPSNLGAHNWQDMAFSPKSGLVYIPAFQLGARFATRVGAGQIMFGGVVSNAYREDEEDGKGTLLAWDPVVQQARWRIPRPYIWNGGPLATAGDLVFQGTAEGGFEAYDAATGKLLWRFDAGLGIISRPISYTAGGKQYISVLVGYGSNAFAPAVSDAGWKYGAQPRRLLTFALGGKALLPATPPPDRQLHAVDDPAYAIVEADLPEGYKLYAMKCALCHGTDAISGNAAAPDLRESAIPLDGEAFWTVIHEAPLAEHGMPRFDEVTRAEADKIRNYLRAVSREALGTRPVTKYPPINFGS